MGYQRSTDEYAGDTLYKLVVHETSLIFSRRVKSGQLAAPTARF
jgi:hypothetical protein